MNWNLLKYLPRWLPCNRLNWLTGLETYLISSIPAVLDLFSDDLYVEVVYVSPFELFSDWRVAHCFLCSIATVEVHVAIGRCRHYYRPIYRNRNWYSPALSQVYSSTCAGECSLNSSNTSIVDDKLWNQQRVPGMLKRTLISIKLIYY